MIAAARDGGRSRVARACGPATASPRPTCPGAWSTLARRRGARRAPRRPDLPDSARLSDGGSDRGAHRASRCKLGGRAMSRVRAHRGARRRSCTPSSPSTCTVGDAVGSRTVTRRHDLGLSPATVRNVMADLEEMGLLEQRHTSAGRVPTPIGPALLHRQLLKVRGLSPREKDEIRERVIAPTARRGRAARVAPAVGSHAARGRDHRARSGSAAARAHRVRAAARRQADRRPGHDRRPDREPAASLDDVDRARGSSAIHNYLNQLLSGMTLDEVRERVIRELGEDKNRYDEAVAAGAAPRSRGVRRATERAADVVVAGQANLLDERDRPDGRARETAPHARGQGDADPAARSHARTPTASRSSSAPRPRCRRSSGARSSRCRTVPRRRRSARSR